MDMMWLKDLLTIQETCQRARDKVLNRIALAKQSGEYVQDPQVKAYLDSELEEANLNMAKIKARLKQLFA